ncbi:hypothetical protein PENTCL1PPCAC_716, partial [Pristionchus entomophagus]
GKMEQQLMSALMHDTATRENYDEDQSWEVRKAAATAIEAMLDNRRDDEVRLAKTFGQLLLSRLKDPVLGVGIHSVYTSLIKRLAVSGSSAVTEVVRDQLPTLLRSVEELMKSQSAKIRQTCFILLSSVARSMPYSLTPCLPQLMQVASASLDDAGASPQMKFDILVFIEDALSNHKPAVLFSSSLSLVQNVSTCVRDASDKVSSQALIVASPLLNLLEAKQSWQEASPLTHAVSDIVSRADRVEHVVHAAMRVAETLICSFPGETGVADLTKTLLRCARGSNEDRGCTMLEATKALAKMANSSQAVHICIEIANMLEIFPSSPFCSVQKAYLEALVAICRVFGKCADIASTCPCCCHYWRTQSSATWHCTS